MLFITLPNRGEFWHHYFPGDQQMHSQKQSPNLEIGGTMEPGMNREPKVVVCEGDGETGTPAQRSRHTKLFLGVPIK